MIRSCVMYALNSMSFYNCNNIKKIVHIKYNLICRYEADRKSSTIQQLMGDYEKVKLQYFSSLLY